MIKYLCMLGGSLLLAGCGFLNNHDTVHVAVAGARSATLKVYDFPDNTLLATGSLSELASGTARIDIERIHEFVKIVVDHGDLIDHASGTDLILEQGRQSLILSAKDLASGGTFVVSPYTQLSACVFEYGVHHRLTRPLMDLHQESRQVLDAHLDIQNIHTRLPPNPLIQTTGLSENHTFGLWIASLYEMTRSHAIESALSPNTTMNIDTLVQALCKDYASDGLFDGQADGQTLFHGDVPLSEHTLRIDLARAMRGYLDSVHNTLNLNLQDAPAFSQSASTNTNPLLFSIDQPSMPLEFDAPFLKIDHPMQNAEFVSLSDFISIPVRVRAHDAGSGIHRIQATVTLTFDGIFSEPLDLIYDETLQRYEGTLSAASLGLNPESNITHYADLSLEVHDRSGNISIETHHFSFRRSE